MKTTVTNILLHKLVYIDEIKCCRTTCLLCDGPLLDWLLITTVGVKILYNGKEVSTDFFVSIHITLILPKIFPIKNFLHEVFCTVRPLRRSLESAPKRDSSR